MKNKKMVVIREIGGSMDRPAWFGGIPNAFNHKFITTRDGHCKIIHNYYKDRNGLSA
jgi:hypothetical protein